CRELERLGFGELQIAAKGFLPRFNVVLKAHRFDLWTEGFNMTPKICFAHETEIGDDSERRVNMNEHMLFESRQYQERQQGHSRSDKRDGELAAAEGKAQQGDKPKGGSGGDSANVLQISQDRSGAQETDPREDARP